MADLVGLVLAAGGGVRFGGPKALARTSTGDPWVRRAAVLLARAGCEEVLVVLGAEADAAQALVPDDATVVVSPRWRQGVGASLADGVAALPEADAALVTLVDLPDVTAGVMARVLATAKAEGAAALVRAAYDGVPGHPVAIGRDHWDAVRATARGDRGARDHLRATPHHLVECGDLATGRDVDTVADLHGP